MWVLWYRHLPDVCTVVHQQYIIDQPRDVHTLNREQAIVVQNTIVMHGCICIVLL